MRLHRDTALSPQLLLPFSSQVHSQNSGLCPPNDSSNPHPPSPYKITSLLGKIPARPSPYLRSPTGFLADTRLSGHPSIFLGKNQNFRKERGNSRRWLIFHCLGREDDGLSPLCYAKGEIKAVVDMVSIAGKEGSIQPSRAASFCISHAW